MLQAEIRNQRDDIGKRLAAGERYFPQVAELEFTSRPLASVFEDLVGHDRARRCFLFSSGVDGRFSYIGLDPFETLTIRGGELVVQTAKGESVIEGSLVDAINSRLENVRSARSNTVSFFQGGAFGYFAYDFIRHLEPRLKKSGYFKKLESDRSTVDGVLNLFDRLLVFDHEAKKAYAVSGARFEDANPGAEEIDARFKEAEAGIESLKEQYLQAIKKAQAKPVAPNGVDAIELEAFGQSLGEETYLKGVRKLQNDIRNGEIFQAVLAEQFSLPVSVDPHALYKALESISPTPYQFHIQGEGVHYLGASPEMLLRVRNGKLETHPIAGTRPRGTNEAEDRKLAAQLRRSEKERAEHLMLVDLARNDLGQISAPGSVKVDRYRDLHMFNSVMHLVSKVTGVLQEGQTALDAFASCFPAGTLSGAPKIRAMELLAELETAPRGFYGGAVVAMSFDGDLDSCISIRSAQVTANETTIQAGAGIVADSKPKREYEEVQHKTRTLRRALAMVIGAAK